MEDGRGIRLQSHQGAAAAGLVLLIDPCAITRESLRGMLNAHRFAVEGSSQIPERVAADLVLLHIGAARIDGPETNARIAAVWERSDRDTGIALIADAAEPELAIQAIRRGLRGYLPTSLSAGMVAAAVGIMRQGGIFVPAESVARLCDANAAAETLPAPVISLGLTDRERDVLLALERGSPNKIIAHELKITESTVKVHVRHIMRKLHATNRTQLAFLSRRLLFPPSPAVPRAA